MALSKIPSAGFQDNVKFRNLIINGDMSIAQRGTSVTGITTGAYHTVDRIITQISSAGTWTQSQSTDVPSGEGFSNSFKMRINNYIIFLSFFLFANRRAEFQSLFAVHWTRAQECKRDHDGSQGPFRGSDCHFRGKDHRSGVQSGRRAIPRKRVSVS